MLIMKNTRQTSPFIYASLVIGMIFLAFVSKAQEAETIFDRKVTLYDDIVEVPMVPRWEYELGIKGNYVLADDVNLWVEDTGEGTPLVLICGGPGTSLHYFHPHFQPAADFSRVIYYDLRGVGMSDYNPGSGYNVLQAVEDLENLRIGLGIDSWAMLGLSFGGVIAQYYAIKYPERVKGMVFVGAFVPTTLDLGIGTRQRDFQSPEEIDKISRIYNVGGQRTAPAHSDLVSPDLQAKMVYNGFRNGDWKRRHLHKISDLELARYARYEWRHDKNYYRQMLQDGLKLDFTHHFKNSPIPILIFEGKWDLAYGDDKPQVMQQIFPNAKMLYFENAGHITFEDEPERFFGELKTFIQQLSPVKASAIEQWQKEIQDLKVYKE